MTYSCWRRRGNHTAPRCCCGRRCCRRRRFAGRRCALASGGSGTALCGGWIWCKCRGNGPGASRRRAGHTNAVPRAVGHGVAALADARVPLDEVVAGEDVKHGGNVVAGLAIALVPVLAAAVLSTKHARGTRGHCRGHGGDAVGSDDAVPVVCPQSVAVAIKSGVHLEKVFLGQDVAINDLTTCIALKIGTK